MQPRRTARRHKYETDASLPAGLRSRQNGAWRIIYLDDDRGWLKSSFDLLTGTNIRTKFSLTLNSITATIKQASSTRYFKDVYSAAPGLLFAYLLVNAMLSLQEALELHSMNRLFIAIEAVVRGKPSAYDVLHAIVIRIIIMNVGALCGWVSGRLTPSLNDRITSSFRSRLIEAHLNLDVVSAQDKSNSFSNFSPRISSQALHGFVRIVTSFLSSLSQLFVTAHLLRKQEGGLMIICLSALSPIFLWATARSTRNMLAVIYLNNSWSLRTLAMYKLATKPKYHEEIVSFGLHRYVSDGYREAARRSPIAHEDDRYRAMQTHASVLTGSITVTLEDLPMIYFALSSVANPTSFSLSTLVILTQLSQTMRSVFQTMVYQNSQVSCYVNGVRKLYAGLDMKPKSEFEAGKTQYPAPGHKGKGMHIEFKNVGFQYPGTEDKAGKDALHDISFTLPASSLVVIVGENGSGKTTLVKLLTGLFRSTTGSILVDGVRMQEYKASDLTKATALLTQNHNIFPMTVSENIGVGNTESVDDLERVREAAKLGGAKTFIESLPDGYETVLQPVETAWSTRFFSAGNDKLKEVMDEVERVKDISGGEKQRLAAARTFMRLLSGNVQLVVVDEPTSAMDPTGEFELFQQLRLMREGKTMVFVTHRFGHLTKHADIILCMKEGKLVESGTHGELIRQSDGEYYKLYNVQAKAFVDAPTVGDHNGSQSEDTWQEF